MATTTIGRLIRLESRIIVDRPITPAGGIDWSEVLTPEEKERLRQIRGRYLASPEPKGTLLETVTDAELDFLEEVAERVNAWQDTEHEGETPIAAT